MSLGGPPPPQWSSDVLRNISNSQDVMRQGSTKVYDALALSEAARHVRTVGDSRRDADLYDMLANTRREETYQPYFPEWPSLLRTMSPTISDMPRMVQEKYRTCQTMCFCGLFPQIQHAWASIDNSLYLWRYDRSNDVPVEYCGEEQAICAVGLVRPRAGVFLEAIEYVIVLCTTTEIVMVGVCPTRRGVDSLDASNAPSLALQPLPMYSLPSDNVVMTCVASSPSTGRIFLGGSDGHLYELQYAAAESWVRKRCTKVRLTGKFVQMLPSFIPALLGYGASGSVDKVVLDDQRHTLYVLINQGYLQVFDLGSSGTDPAKKVAEVADFYQAAAGASGGRDVFRNAAGEKKSAAVKHITPIPLSESSKLHLLAITADGRRVYFTTHMLRQSYYTPAYQPAINSSMLPQAGQAPPPPRPVTLMAVFSRQALPHAGVSLTRSQADLARPAALEVMIAHYSQDTLLLSEAAGSDGRTTKLLVACRNATLPQASTNLGSSTGAGGGVSHAGLRELLSELGTSVPGETCAIEALPGTANGLELLPEALPGSGTVGGLPGAHDDLAAQLFRAPPRFVLISTAGVVRLERRRPLEILSVLLEERVTKQVNQFFEAYGAPEAAAMCLALATTPPGTLLTAVVDNATACLDNPALVGEARMPQDVPQMEAGGLGAFGMGATNGIFMGQAVNPHPEPDWSAGHQGLCLYVSRLTSPVWEVRLVGPAGSDTSGLLVPRLPRPATEALLGKLRLLEVFLGDYITRKQARGSQSRYTPVGSTGPYALPKGFGAGYMGNAQDDVANAHAKRQRLVHASTLEDDRTQRLRHLVAKSAQALALMHVLADNNLGRIAVSLTDTQRTQLQGLTLRDLVCDSEGEQLASQLINVLVNQYLDASTSGAAAMGPVSGVEGVVGILQKQCPAFFKEEDRKFYQASAQLKAAQSESPGPERNSMVKKALEVLKEVPALANLESLTSQLAYLKAYAEVLEVPLAAAAAQDPANAALRPEMGPEYESARQRRRDAYRAVLNMLRQLCAGTGNPAAAAAMAAGVPQAEAAVLSSPERSTAKSALLKACFQASDVFFHQCLYETLIEEGESATLLANNPPHLQAYLASESGLAGGLESAGRGAEPPPVGPLSAQQCKLAELLAKLFVSLRRFREAAAVYKCLAVRRAGSGTQAVPLAQRVTFLQAAVLQARSAGDSTQVTSLEADLKSMTLQATTADRVQTLRAACASDAPEATELSRQETELCSRLIDVSSLYNDVAQPLRLWDICLQIVDFAGGSGVEAAVVRQLWDHVLMAALDGGDNGIRSAGAAANGTQGGLAGAASVVERLGAQFYPNQHSCPLPYVVFRLVQISCGRWPGSTSAPPSSPSAGEEVVARAVLSASGGTVTQALRCFELLLTRRAPDVPEQELAPLPMRLAVLRCLAQLCKVAYSELGSALISPGLAPVPSGSAGAASAPGGLSPVPGAVIQREAGGLADACERFGLEAKRLGTPDATDLAESFAAVRQAVQQRLGSRW